MSETSWNGKRTAVKKTDKKQKKKKLGKHIKPSKKTEVWFHKQTKFKKSCVFGDRIDFNKGRNLQAKVSSIIDSEGGR